MIEREFDRLYIGSNISHLLEAYVDGSPIIITERPQYFSFDLLGVAPKGQVWSRLMFSLSMAGLLPCGGVVNSCRTYPNDDNSWLVEVVDSNEISYKFHVGALREPFIAQVTMPADAVKPAHNRGEEFQGSGSVKMYDVIDWFDVVSGKVHEYDQIALYKNRFIERIIFPPTPNSKSEVIEKNAIAFSTMAETEDLIHDYSELAARLEVEKQMKAKGIKGRKNGFRENGKQKYLKLRLEHNKRVVRPKIRGEEISSLYTRYAMGRTYFTRDVRLVDEKYGDPFSICYGS